MADRMHPYPMFPQNLTSNSLQQSQIPQQPPQSQQPDPQMISALSNTEHSRMWQQMNQLQNSYRQQQSGDMTTAPQMNHQMQEFVRGQPLPHGQGQPLVQQIQQPFGLTAQRVNPPGPVFHDPQPNQSQSIIPSSFSNMPMNTQQQMKAAFNMNPMNPMMHAAMANPGVSRQLKMLSQQEIARLQQSGLGTQHPNQVIPDMFTSSSLQPSQDQLHGSPHPAAQSVGPPGANQSMVAENQQQTVQKRTIALPEFQERRNYLLNLISQSENAIASLAQNARTANEPHLQQQLSQLRQEHASRKDVYNKFLATFGAMVTQQMANGMASSNAPHINPVSHSMSQQPQQVPVSNVQGQPGFVAQANPPVAAPFKFPTGPTGSVPSPIPGQPQTGLNQHHPGQPIGRSNIPPRTGGTPHQISSGSLSNNMSPNLGNFAAQGGQKVPHEQTQSMPAPLDKTRFESTYAQFCRSQNINIPTSGGLRVQIAEGRAVDLHQLHVQVMHEHGAEEVTKRDMWAVIGGQLGFVQFPGNGTEPPRSGPGTAQQLHNTYEKYLRHFENAYVLTVRNRAAGGSPQPPMNQINPNALAVGSNPTPGMSGNPAEVPPNPPRPNPNQQLIAAALRFVLVNAQDMRAQRVPEHMINFVERHRHELMKVYQQQAQAMAKRNAEQGQQNMANAQAQASNMREQSFVGLLPGVSRPPQPMGANAMAGITGEAKMANGFVPENVVAFQKQPTQDQVHHAMIAINQCKQLFQQRSLPGISPQHIPEEQRIEYNQALEQVYKMTSELEPKLPLYFAVFRNDEVLRKYVAIVMTVARQRQLSTANSPQYIISLSTLRNMHVQVHRLNEEFENRWRVMRTSAVAAAANPHQHTSLPSAPTRASPLAVPQVQNISQMGPPTPQNNGRPASITPRQPTPSQTHLQPPPQHHSQPGQTQPQPQSQHQSIVSPSIKKNIQPPIPASPSAPPPLAAIASPTPPPTAATASSSTPATSTPTPQPTHSSPQTPKSPPSKAVGKAKVPARVRKMSSASKGAAAPEMAAVAGVKRPAEEDIAATLNAVAPSQAEASNAPSPKKAKTEWEGEPSEALVKKQQEIDNIKTDEDAAAFFDRMKELLAMTASTDNEIQHDLASTLDQILAGVAQGPADAAVTTAALSVHGAGDAGPPPTALSPLIGPANDAFLEYIDFSSFTTLEDEDNDSKAPTPDLVPSSETNPSPESGSEGESSGSTGSPDKIKIDEPGDRSDPLRLGALGEIDGGESAYYQTSEWKWEGPMYTLDQPWAISTS